ncbi:hypothetical protein ACIBI9_51915 [Nonomuraea sp. NPDC050451]|uniref:hypothetical protein n=1 Tax=Nonomuraea sp. NPDC050451 TaxID=3364364 RepID=UPI0037BDF627
MGWDLNGPRDLEYAVNGEYVTGFSVTVPGKRWGCSSNWESDPDLPPGWLEYCAREEDIPEDWQDFISPVSQRIQRDANAPARHEARPARREQRGAALIEVLCEEP